MRKYRNDYPREPIGGGNPYHRCARCKVSVPEINGEIDGHEEWCEWRKSVELEATLRAENEQLKGEVERVREALTPSAETKGVYMGEFSMRIPEFDEDGNEFFRTVNVPWITIKEIMKAISARAAIHPPHG